MVRNQDNRNLNNEKKKFEIEHSDFEIKKLCLN